MKSLKIVGVVLGAAAVMFGGYKGYEMWKEKQTPEPLPEPPNQEPEPVPLKTIQFINEEDGKIYEFTVEENGKINYPEEIVEKARRRYNYLSVDELGNYIFPFFTLYQKPSSTTLKNNLQRTGTKQGDPVFKQSSGTKQGEAQFKYSSKFKTLPQPQEIQEYELDGSANVGYIEILS